MYKSAGDIVITRNVFNCKSLIMMYFTITKFRFY